MFGWLKRKRQPARLDPESRWIVEADEHRIIVTDPAGETSSVEEGDLCAIAIETNDSGPWGADLWWLLFGAETLACAFPQGATGEQKMIDYLTALPSFNHEEMAKAMASTANAVFPVWTKK
jgi:hypothetical protein